MFLFRSIRRRLVSLFTGVMLLVIAMAVIGAFGLVWHQDAVDELDFLLHRSPDLAHLSRSMSRIPESLFSSLDLRQPAAVQQQRQVYLSQIEKARESLHEFRHRVKVLDLSIQQQEHVLARLDDTYGDLDQLSNLEQLLQLVRNSEDANQNLKFRADVSQIVARIQKTLENLPAYCKTADRGEKSLQKQRQRSESLLRWLLTGTAIVIAVSIAILTGIIKWISMPVRAIARGCTRIADGDTQYRLPLAFRWQDEFADLVAGVNCMADRFQQAEEELQYKVRERSEQLIRSQKLANVGFLAAGVAHEINNPLSAISVAAESLEMRLYELVGMRSDDAREVLERIAMIRRESRRCGDITHRLLDFSHGDKAGWVPTDITNLIGEVLKILQHLGRYADRIVSFECDHAVIAEVNAAQFKQVILNLVANGLQATASGGRVNVRLLEQVDSVVIAIEDDGCGMDEETLQHIFDPFFTTKEAGQGTGLGLSITHRIIENHAGTITPLSKGPGRGSTFQIRIPKRQRQVIAA